MKPLIHKNGQQPSAPGYPAVAGVTKALAPILEKIDASELDYVKKEIGAMVRCVMESNGYSKIGTKLNLRQIPHSIIVTSEVCQGAALPE